jgi:hypothetical protein
VRENKKLLHNESIVSVKWARLRIHTRTELIHRGPYTRNPHHPLCLGSSASVPFSRSLHLSLAALTREGRTEGARGVVRESVSHDFTKVSSNPPVSLVWCAMASSVWWWVLCGARVLGFWGCWIPGNVGCEGLGLLRLKIFSGAWRWIG